jgi:hypothetical protein
MNTEPEVKQELPEPTLSENDMEYTNINAGVKHKERCFLGRGKVMGLSCNMSRSNDNTPSEFISVLMILHIRLGFLTMGISY